MNVNWNYAWVLVAIAAASLLLGWGINLLLRRRSMVIATLLSLVGLAGVAYTAFLAPILHPLAFNHSLAIAGIFFWVGWRNSLWWSPRFKRFIKLRTESRIVLYQRVYNLIVRLGFLALCGGFYIFALYLSFEFPWGYEIQLGGRDAAIYPVSLALTFAIMYLVTQIYGRANMIVADTEKKEVKLLHLRSPAWIASFKECTAVVWVFHPMRPHHFLLAIHTIYENDLILDAGSDIPRLQEIADWFAEKLEIPALDREDASIAVD